MGPAEFFSKIRQWVAVSQSRGLQTFWGVRFCAKQTGEPGATKRTHDIAVGCATDYGLAPHILLEGRDLDDSRTAPVLFVGVPRSGTTAIFELFASHPDLAWVSNYSKLFPNLPILNLTRPAFDNRFWRLVGAKNQFGDQHWFNRLLPRPDESYPFWEAHTQRGFARDYLLRARPDSGVAERLQNAFLKVSQYQRRSRVAAKLTGPGRVAYLRTALPDAYFVHVIRDAFSVIRSLLSVEFWRNGGGLETPWWRNGLTAEDLRMWETFGHDPVVLAALQWRRIAETTLEEASLLPAQQCVTVHYEAFCEAPRSVIEDLWYRTGLPVVEWNSTEALIRSKTYAESWSKEEVRRVLTCVEPLFSDLGYKPPAT